MITRRRYQYQRYLRDLSLHDTETLRVTLATRPDLHPLYRLAIRTALVARTVYSASSCTWREAVSKFKALAGGAGGGS